MDAPRNAKVHELISLALFALGHFRPAASEAHAAMALGPIADWNDLYGYYNDANKYTTQLRALEKAATDNPKDAADHFLLGYHYLMIGARDNAKTEFADAGEVDPQGQACQPLPAGTPVQRAAHAAGDGVATPRQSVVTKYCFGFRHSDFGFSDPCIPYFCIRACSVGRGSPSSRAACVWLPCDRRNASTIRSRSIFSSNSSQA